jgi:hypothetical protein
METTPMEELHAVASPRPDREGGTLAAAAQLLLAAQRKIDALERENEQLREAPRPATATQEVSRVSQLEGQLVELPLEPSDLRIPLLVALGSQLDQLPLQL